MINTILVTDDNALDNAILRNSLYHEHYNIISALNGREALDMIESRNVDLILLDMIMPVMDGIAFLNEFKKTSYYHTIPVIMTTSIDKAEIIEKVVTEFELFDYVIKPLDPINRLILVNKIKAAIRYRNAVKELQELKSKMKQDGE
ncbi:MAG: response regulator [Clostridia bacterium]|nr:response regulator [Clostridia bacterium]